jgi:UDP-N-acetylmuramate dehydrogenase
MIIQENCSLLPYNTFGIDVNADYLIKYELVADLQEVLKLKIMQSNQILQIGSGSNLLFLSDYKGVVLHSEIKNIKTIEENSDYIYIEVGAGIVWDNFVSYTVKNNWSGIENLSLIPGEIGASAVQNIGAYGVEVKDVIENINAVCIETGSIKTFSNKEAHYAYRQSIFKNELKNKYIISSVVFRLAKNPTFKLDYQHLEQEVRKNGEVNLDNIRNTIIKIRESKLPNPKIIGNAGSFFMNPVIKKTQYLELQSKFETIPHYPISETLVKVPAAWLIEQCGWKGKQVGNAAVHDKQALVLINNGNATGTEIKNLSMMIQKSVLEKFEIKLIPEVIFV